MRNMTTVLAGLGLAVSVGVVVSVHERAPDTPPQGPQPDFGGPVNIYASDVYAPPREDGEIHPSPVRGQVWVLTGEPGEANVVVQIGDQGVLVVDTGTKPMAPKLLAQIKRLADSRGGERKEIRKIINTNG